MSKGKQDQASFNPWLGLVPDVTQSTIKSSRCAKSSLNRDLKKVDDLPANSISLSILSQYKLLNQSLRTAVDDGKSFVTVQSRQKGELAKVWALSAFPLSIENLPRVPLNRAAEKLNYMLQKPQSASPVVLIRFPKEANSRALLFHTGIDKRFVDKAFSRAQEQVMSEAIPLGVMTLKDWVPS